MNSLDLNVAFGQIRDIYRPTIEKYPAFAVLSTEQKKAFVISHSIQHLCKSLGRIASECEILDHGHELNERVLTEHVAKMFIDILKLADDLGITPTQIFERMPTLTQPRRSRPRISTKPGT